MFKKIPYGVKVRVRGNEQDGFVAEYALNTTRFLPCFDNWSLIRNSNPTKYSWDWQNTFPTLELAKEAAMEQYDSWIDFYKRREETNRILKAQRRTVWKHP